jgi:hypothetical protein
MDVLCTVNLSESLLYFFLSADIIMGSCVNFRYDVEKKLMELDREFSDVAVPQNWI